MADVEKPPGEESPESCPELDDDYFASIGESMHVVDSWEEEKSNEAGDNASDAMPKPKIKTEPDAAPRSSRDRKESDRSDNSSSRDPRVKSSGRDKVSRSPERKRSPYRRPSRFSPPGGRRRQRSRSPPRHQQPRRGNASNKPSFLDEITEKFPELKSVNPNNINNNNNRTNNFHQNQHNRGYMQPQMMNVGPNFMPVGYMPQPFPNQPFQMLDSYGQPIAMNMYNNQVMNPMMPIGASPMNIMQPMPVPAPLESLVIPSAPLINNRGLSDEKEASKRATNSPIDLLQAKKKAFADKKISVVDYLKQVSQQTTKSATEAEIKAKRLKVHERCKSAAKLLDDLTKSKYQMPFVCRVPLNPLPTIKCDPKLQWKSPLTMSDTNAQFMLQATRENNTRDALQANPLRNISGSLFQFARNLGSDLYDISEKVQRRVDLETASDVRLAEGQEIANTAVNAVLRKGHRSTQTDMAPCRECEQRKTKKFKTLSVQTLPYEPEQRTEPGSFNANLDAKTMQELTRKQQSILLQFCHLFNIQDERFVNATKRSWSDDDSREAQPDDRMTYANPENPNAVGNNFISFSPVHDSSQRPYESPSRSLLRDSPPRMRAAPMRQHESPLRMRGSPSRMRASPQRMRESPQRMRSLSPQRRRSSSPRVRESPPARRIPITARLGGRVQDSSPRSFHEDHDVSHRFLQQQLPYRLPSPAPPADRYRRDVLYSSNGSRNRSRSRSGSPSHIRQRFSRSPVRSRRPQSPDVYARQGRY